MSEYLEIVKQRSASFIEKKDQVHALRVALGCFGVSVYTLFDTPDHVALHRIVEYSNMRTPQPLHPSVAETTEDVGRLLDSTNILTPERLQLTDKVAAAAYMMQFSDHFLSDREPPYTLDYDHMLRIKDAFTSRAQQKGSPLDYTEQLDAALAVNEGDIISSLFTLCFSSRQYARWLDRSMIRNMPALATEDVLRQMQEWRETLLACKSESSGMFQDPAGDTYYTWTHALAKVVFSVQPRLYDRAAAGIFARGTDVMHTLVHSLNNQSVPNSHRTAAIYGNALGGVIVSRLANRVAANANRNYKVHP